MIVLLLALTGASLATWFATRPEAGANETGSGAAASDEGADEQADGEDPASEGDEGADDERRSRSRGRPSVDVDGRRVLHRLAGFAAVGFAVVTVAYTAAMSFTVVPVQQVGIPVTFGTPGSPMNNGIHPKLPWTTVTLMDGTVQIDDNLGDRRTEIRLGNQSIAYVQNNVRWRIRPEAADLRADRHRARGARARCRPQRRAAGLQPAGHRHRLGEDPRRDRDRGACAPERQAG